MKIVTRREWGAAPPKGTPEHVDWPKGVSLWVHHTTGPSDQTPKEIQAFHQGPSRGWNDVGYGYLIREDGTVYEGRGYEVQAAHSPGVNHQPSVALIGDYSTRAPSDAQHRSVYALRALLDAGKLRGHRENTATSCPGDAAMAKIVNGPPPRPKPAKPPRPPKLTLLERLLAAGFGLASAKKIIAALKRKEKQP